MAIAAEHQPPKPTPETSTFMAGRWRVDPQASHARFVARGFGGLVTTPGRFGSLSGDLVVDKGHTSGALVVDSSSIDTNNRFRDRHLRSRDFFHVERHPHLRYEVRSIALQEAETARIEGELFLAGTRTPLTLNVSLHRLSHQTITLACRAQVDRFKLGIRGARAMVPRVVQLDVAITLRRAIA
jgi:polyisoprenoid-binding protein YceI